MSNNNLFKRISNRAKEASEKNLASMNVSKQIWGAIQKRCWLSFWILFLLLVILPAVILLNFHLAPIIYDVKMPNSLWWHLVEIVILTMLTFLTISVCRTLTDVFSLRKEETGITWCQISILIAIGIWIIGFIVIFNIQKDSRYYLAFGVTGTLLAWILQDTVKGVVAFIHLRMNKLLNIGDWIQIPQKNVDGEVVHVTLTTVTICNWDTTTSSVPTSVLHTDHFINLQNMTTGKTYGRRMCRIFILDTDLFHSISVEEANDLRMKQEIIQYLPVEEIQDGMTNAQLFRMYLLHWMMNHPRVSQKPSLIVRWMEQMEFGMPLQVYAYILDGSFAAFEWQQSMIVEHIMVSMEWFGLRMYQSPSSYEAANSNIHLSDKEIDHKRELK